MPLGGHRCRLDLFDETDQMYRGYPFHFLVRTTYPTRFERLKLLWYGSPPPTQQTTFQDVVRALPDTLTRIILVALALTEPCHVFVIARESPILFACPPETERRKST